MGKRLIEITSNPRKRSSKEAFAPERMDQMRELQRTGGKECGENWNYDPFSLNYLGARVNIYSIPCVCLIAYGACKGFKSNLAVGRCAGVERGDNSGCIGIVSRDATWFRVVLHARNASSHVAMEDRMSADHRVMQKDCGASPVMLGMMKF
ncbi:hypothetical protein NE237_022770 [Protea cynaroides]|uniref:Uncharacterized protein n=1 Tax=Protea cynaroides TaxID=273540 RepID=A0A9Q0HCL7_9MAGN|nr:hypothetical protein NE237_022770 [Protea cynaroides]